VKRYWHWILGHVCAAAAIALTIANSEAANAPKRIIFLHSYSQNFKPWSEYAKALRRELDLQSNWSLSIEDFSVITGRAEHDETAEREFVDYISALFSSQLPDLIVTFGGPAAGFVQRHRQELFPTTPILLTAVDRRRVQQIALTENDAVVAVRQNISLLFGNILELLPATKIVAVVIGNSPNERIWIEEMKRELEPLKDRMELLFLNDRSFEDILKRAATLPPNSAIFWSQPQVDAIGAVHEGETELNRLYQNANAPIFSYDDSFFEGQIVGGPMTSAEDSARTATIAAIRILNGERPADIKLPPQEYGPAKYDWRLLQRWRINESRLPAGSEIRFREPAVWEQYRWQIALICAVLLLQGALISGLLFERNSRLRAEVQARQRSAELAHVNRYSMAGELTAAIAHELSQPLAAIMANAEAAELIVKSPTPDLLEIGEIIADIRRDDERASEVIRRLRLLLKKAPLEHKHIDVNEVARESVQLLSAWAIGRKVDLNSFIAPTPLPIEGDFIQLQQVIVNLVVNAADAMSNMSGSERRITVSTARDGDIADLSVSDMGPGIPVEMLKEIFEPFFTTKPEGMGMGLSIAWTIVDAHGGRLLAQNRAARGAVFRIRLPLAAMPQ
jgi:signal transduction histidine kinase